MLVVIRELLIRDEQNPQNEYLRSFQIQLCVEFSCVSNVQCDNFILTLCLFLSVTHFTSFS